jgi:hypothetical protein
VDRKYDIHEQNGFIGLVMFRGKDISVVDKGREFTEQLQHDKSESELCSRLRFFLTTLHSNYGRFFLGVRFWAGWAAI